MQFSSTEEANEHYLGDSIKKIQQAAPRLIKRLDRMQKVWAGRNSLHAKVKAAHSMVDAILAAGEVSKCSVCKRGCNKCCEVDVDVSGIEAMVIADIYGIPQQKKIERSRRGYTTLCPFNVGGDCSIYQHRPIACRSFFTLDDPAICHDDPHATHVIFTSQSNGSISDIQDHLYKMTGTFCDIRDVYHGHNNKM